ncbi:hypothetical protein [Noviherbaspirillum humi]|uniref:hypothetical protein n=1 Tax=Noviherbaspirillum humi TaxID=1688639 RepID=UPI001160BBAF|nr:hypothetical protein [Noviherbaspirillum humi]
MANLVAKVHPKVINRNRTFDEDAVFMENHCVDVCPYQVSHDPTSQKTDETDARVDRPAHRTTCDPAEAALFRPDCWTAWTIKEGLAAGASAVEGSETILTVMERPWKAA